MIYALKEVYSEGDVEALKKFSGKFVVRLPEEMHSKASLAAATRGLSLNTFVQRAVKRELEQA